MKKNIARLAIWLLGVICMLLVCNSWIQPVFEKELINSERYLVTSELGTGDVLEQSITLKRKGLKQISVAFVYEEEVIGEQSEVLVEILSDDIVHFQTRVGLNSLPNRTLTPFQCDFDEIGNEVTVRITNISEESTAEKFSLLYTDNSLRMFENVTQYEINGDSQLGQLISEYTYMVGYDYYKALTIAFGIFLICLSIDTILFKR